MDEVMYFSFSRFKGLSERPLSECCCLHRVVLFSLSNSSSVYLRGDKRVIKNVL